jgi:hypothetical protein
MNATAKSLPTPNPKAAAAHKAATFKAGATKPVAVPDIEMEVLDTTATKIFRERQHDVVLPDGLTKPYTFHYGQKTKMPFGHAMQFLKHDAFHVFEVGSDERYNPAPEQPGQGGTFKLKTGTTIAAFDELTNEALAKRAGQYPDGDGFRKQSPKADLVAFLIAKQRAGAPSDAPETEEDAVDGEDDLLSDDDYDPPPLEDMD